MSLYNISFLLVVIFPFIYLSKYVDCSKVNGFIGHTNACEKSRKVFNDSWGTFSDGPLKSNYSQNSYCQWLIKANNTKQFINLKVLFIETECSYDYLFIYDGESFNSQLLGSLSGNNSPLHLTATSGYMLILLYSDANYALEGFSVEYSVTDCPHNCSFHGTCIQHTCICDDDWTGYDCSKERCPFNCNQPSYAGMCVQGQCICSSGFSGEACTLSSFYNEGNRWHTLRSNVIPGRAGHSIIYIPNTDALYMFGGYNLNSVMNDLVIFKFSNSRWHDEFGNVIEGNDTEWLQPLHTILSKSQSPDSKWGVKSQTFLQNILASYANNETLRNLYNMKFEDDSVHSSSKSSNDSTKDGHSYKRNKPIGRYGHAASRYYNGFVMYGGKLADGYMSDELWFYNSKSARWSLRADYKQTNKFPKPVALMHHTLTVTKDNWIYIIGGSTDSYDISSAIFKIKLRNAGGDEKWYRVEARGGKQFDYRVTGHSTVYDEDCHSFIIYGGLISVSSRFSKLSDRMFIFNINQQQWSRIQYPRYELSDAVIPLERAFHTANIMGKYMVVFGGYTHRHNKQELCYDKHIYLYHLDCHTWLSPDILGAQFDDDRYPLQQGLFAHASDMRGNSTLLIVGGYQGIVSSVLLAFSFPDTLVTNNAGEMCHRHGSLIQCTADPKCGWCSSDDHCYSRDGGVNCTTNLQTTRCPGICSALRDCHSCLAHSYASNFHSQLAQCSWCVHSSRCQHAYERFAACGSEEEMPSHIPGWWGQNGTEITDINYCTSLDRKPGLTLIKYYHPVNTSLPDFVEIVNSTKIEITGIGYAGNRGTSTSELFLNGQLKTVLKGSIHLPKSWNSTNENIQTCIVTNSALVSIKASVGNAQLHLNEVKGSSNLCKSLPSEMLAVIDHDQQLLNNNTLSLSIDFDIRKTFSPSTFNAPSVIIVQHNKNNDHFKAFTIEYLETYKASESNTTCADYSNCLLCLTDSRCAWCKITAFCLQRSINESLTCMKKQTRLLDSSSDPDPDTDIYTEWQYLVITAEMCDNCYNYVSCDTCVLAGCEWWPYDARCNRVGRLASAIKSISECPLECHKRDSCDKCMGSGRCSWCYSTQECFALSGYTSKYQFGQCRDWIESSEVNGPDVCRACPYFTNCSSCIQGINCGWSYQKDKPIIGSCVAGFYSEPYEESNKNIYGMDTRWAYVQCPDVDECNLGLHDCHPEAKCVNTHGSYSCQCRRGFIGDGRHSCTKTCYHNCLNGYCVGAPQYVCKCDLGWTGVDCSTDCGCNKHSTCTAGVGKCDKCQEWTTGQFCQLCKAGAYGNATFDRGCEPCDCNKHGNESMGICEPTTGACFCIHHTQGHNCDTCVRHFFGDPRNGGMCFHQCMPRAILNGDGVEGFGSKVTKMTKWESKMMNGPPSEECLWIISPYYPADITKPVLIEVTIHADIKVPCSENSVYVYDGLPQFISSNSHTYHHHQSHMLGALCSEYFQYPLVLHATSGILTVHYKQSSWREGFNATYEIFHCNNCPTAMDCARGYCSCKEGTTGFKCSSTICSNNCTAHLDHGYCDKEYGRCVCKEGYGASDCSISIQNQQLVFTELFNSAHLSEGFEHLRHLLPRFGHTIVADRRGLFWLFGGFSLSYGYWGPLNDIRLFDTKNNTWIQVTIDSTNDANMPQGRYFHAAEISINRREIFVFGGLSLKDSNTLNILRDFWKFNLKSHQWMEMEITIESKDAPPALVGHTMTLVRNADIEYLVIIGGFNMNHGFLQDVWQFNLHTLIWQNVKTYGISPLGIYGHSCVFHESSARLYVFGGYTYSLNNTRMSNRLYVLDYLSKTWTILHVVPSSSTLPYARFLHSAATSDTHMFIFGGKTDASDFTSDGFIAYSYTCNQWLYLSSKECNTVGIEPVGTFADAMALDVDSSDIYVVGGLPGHSDSHVTRIHLPQDICSSFASTSNCRKYLDCSTCSIIGENSTKCYWNNNNSKSILSPCHDIAGPNKLIATDSGYVCNRYTSCQNYLTCTQCLFWHTSQNCVWCSDCGSASGSSSGHCVSADSSCDNHCKLVSQITGCQDIHCPATNCERCNTINNCMWTRQMSLTEDSAVKVNTDPIYEWSCVPEKMAQQYAVKIKSQVNNCPAHCANYNECDSCLAATGADGGWHECRWSIKLNQCISPSFQSMYCVGGVCGLVLKPGNNDQCPQPCSNYSQCSTCLSHAHCGWCALHRDNTTGQGICWDRSAGSRSTGPEYSTCDELYYSKTVTDKPELMNDTFSWHYVSCPPENECLNGHNNCDKISEQCVDLDISYECKCASGYRTTVSSEDSIGSVGCVAYCKDGCDHGTCIKPNICECEFGYVGHNCAVQCQCNGHSNCAGVDKLDVCLECHNNTKGTQCEKCKPLFVGEARNNGRCIPCIEYCNGHTHLCVGSNLDEQLLFDSYSNLEDFLKEGPTEKTAHCISCKNNTTGAHCSNCVEGYFRGSHDFRDNCRPCECHGHSDTCDPVTGEKCNCQNNTESDGNCKQTQFSTQGQIQSQSISQSQSPSPSPSPSQSQSQSHSQSHLHSQSSYTSAKDQCWMKQCTKCKETYLGSPINGHQCYKQMNVDMKFCLDGKLIEECKMKPRALYPGQATFFVVQPRFMNVDIRILLDISQGSVDVFLSSRDDMFVMTRNDTHSSHAFNLDAKFHWIEGTFATEDISKNLTWIATNNRNVYLVQQQESKGLTSHVLLKNRHSIMVVRNLTDRLVVTLPQEKHDLGATKFYIALLATGTSHTPAYGTMFFRQDQLHIDLFVFFSVFFSFFFLFLAACVVGWKAKQAADFRRARRQQMVEMMHMASRPFPSVTLLFHQSLLNGGNNRRKLRPNVANRMTEIRPVSIEPTSDSAAAVCTLLMTLPSSGNGPVRLVLVSTLIQITRSYNPNNRSFLRYRS